MPHERLTENQIQIRFIKWMKEIYPNEECDLFHPDNSSNKTIQRRGLLKQMGWRSGVSDLVLLYPNRHFHGLCLELKSCNRKLDSKRRGQYIEKHLSEDQKVFLTRKNKLGYAGCVAINLEEAQNVIKYYIEDDGGLEWYRYCRE